MKSGDFKKKNTQAHRKQESDLIREKYPDRVPVIIEQGGSWDHCPLDKAKYLVPNDVTIFHLQYILRKRVKLSDRESIFLFCGTHMVKSDTLVSRLYQTRKDPDGFLYLTYSQESVFGATRHIQGLQESSVCSFVDPAADVQIASYYWDSCGHMKSQDLKNFDSEQCA